VRDIKRVTLLFQQLCDHKRLQFEKSAYILCIISTAVYDKGGFQIVAVNLVEKNADELI